MILCAGESLIDMVPRDGLFQPLPGGSVWNTALALGRLGAPAGYLWPISRDGFGESLLRPLADAGVDTALCPRSDRPTTLAFVTLTGGEARYAFYDEGSAGRMLQESDLPALPGGLTALFIGGISLVPDPCGAAVEVLATRAAADGVPVMLDPNIRPFFIADAAAHRDRLDRLIGLASIVKLSADDLAWLNPGADPAQAARALLDRGPALVLQTGGAAGAVAHTARGSLRAPAIRVAVADTIGAGDTFNAGMLDALHRAGALSRLAALDDATLAAALAHAARAAAITVSRPGADPPWARELPAD
ncbi:carbohydrate kinase family protein [Paracoccus luteus]|uniref:carbohydrate kinase family protein n=1 Tax=Paracoccus luteus TaxID=2508543 RepID=UPI00106FC942|nr:carbohydrate kinase [Paracoccus luteus]